MVENVCRSVYSSDYAMHIDPYALSGKKVLNNRF